MIDLVGKVQDGREPPTPGEWKSTDGYRLRPVADERVLSRPGREKGAWLSEPTSFSMLPRKEVIQPHLPVRLPCYDFTPITDPTLDACPLTVSLAASDVADFRGVTGGVYKTRERIHRDVLTHGY
jgi:hypothetical protein